MRRPDFFETDFFDGDFDFLRGMIAVLSATILRGAPVRQFRTTSVRLREVYHQLADGINMATKEEAAKKIACHFKRTPKGYVYTITFAQRYLEPLVLKRGSIAGFGMFLHDRDDASLPPGIKGLSLATKSGSRCDNPRLWPLMILSANKPTR